MWNERTLGELCADGGGRIQTGPFGSQLHQSDYEEVGTPVVMPTNINDGRIDTAAIARVSESHVHRLRRHKLSLGDIVYGRRGDIGRQAITREENVGWLCGTGCLRVSLGNAEVESDFLHRYLATPNVIGWIQGQAIGATMPNLNTSILERVPVKYPDLRTQRKIAAVLGAYDDLIETNTRRIALLERMAEGLYREWFVRMRFPGHEHATFEKGVPTTWCAGTLGDVAAVNERSIRKRNRPETIHYVDIGSVTTNRIHGASTMPFEEAPGRARRIVRHGDIIWSSVRPANRAYSLIYEPRENTVASTGFAVITPRTVPYSFLHFAVTTDSFVDWISLVAKGSAYPATSFDDFEKAGVLIPEDHLLDAFHERCEPMLRQVHVLSEQNAKLAETRDLLLPRLISGTLSVADLDIQLPPSMRGDEDTDSAEAPPVPQAEPAHA